VSVQQHLAFKKAQVLLACLETDGALAEIPPQSDLAAAD
jgi:hypothetical protein